MKNEAMHEGKELGRALTEAMSKKGIGPTELAGRFGIKPPSVSDWKARGCISKKHLPGVILYFRDVVSIEHWGLSNQTASALGINPTHFAEQVPAHYAVHGSKIRQALDVLETALTQLNMAGRDSIAPLLESFARSPGPVGKNDIARVLENPSAFKSHSAEKTQIRKAG